MQEKLDSLLTYLAPCVCLFGVTVVLAVVVLFPTLLVLGLALTSALAGLVLILREKEDVVVGCILVLIGMTVMLLQCLPLVTVKVLCVLMALVILLLSVWILFQVFHDRDLMKTLMNDLRNLKGLDDPQLEP